MTILRHKASRAGFTLAELLVVITIVALLSVATGPAISALTSSGGANQNISQLSGLIEQAREYAVSQNTYVWVALYSPTPADGTVSIAVVASTDGTDAANANGVSTWQTNPYGQVPATGYALISKVVTLKQFSILSAGRVSPSTLPSTPSSSNSISNSGPLIGGLGQTGYGGASATGGFTIQIPGQSTQTFVPVIQFTPSGQVRNSSSPIDVIDFDLQPERGTVADPNNVAVLRLNGLTGEGVVYRQ